MNGQKQHPPRDPPPLDYIPQRRISVFDQLRPQRWNWDLAKQPLDRMLDRQAAQPITATQRRNLRFFWLDGFFAAASEAFYLAYIPLFALAYGATNQQVGWITAVGNLMGALALFPGARFMERTGERKRLVVWSGGGVARVALLLMSLMPLFGLPPMAAILAITSLNGLRAFMGNFANPAWTSIVAEIVPEFMRGRYFSARNISMGLATLVLTTVAGWLIRSGNLWTLNPYLGFQVVFFLAFVVGMFSTYFFSRIEEPSAKMTQAAVAQTGGLRHTLRNSTGFLGFVISGFVWNFSLQLAGPFFSVYMVTDLGADTTMVGITTSISALTSLGGQLVFGRLLDRKGAIWLQLVTGFPIVVLPTLWMFYTSPEQVAVNNVFGGFLWAGYNLANFNLLLTLTPAAGRGRAVALYQTGVFVSAVLGPLVGGYLADNVSFPLIFGLSGLGRLIGMLLFVWLTAWPIYKIKRARLAAQEA